MVSPLNAYILTTSSQGKIAIFHPCYHNCHLSTNVSPIYIITSINILLIVVLYLEAVSCLVKFTVIGN